MMQKRDSFYLAMAIVISYVVFALITILSPQTQLDLATLLVLVGGGVVLSGPFVLAALKDRRDWDKQEQFKQWDSIQ